jgi:hypothetical protein
MDYRRRIQYTIQLVFLVMASAYSQTRLQFFLSSLNQTALDSTTETRHHYRTGIQKDRIVTLYSHYYGFNVQKANLLRKTSIKLTEYYNKKGVLVRKDSLAPPELGVYIIKYFRPNGRKKKVIVYRRRDPNSQNKIAGDNTPPQGFEKVFQYNSEVGGEEIIRYSKKEPLKYLVEQQGNSYRIVTDLFTKGHGLYSRNKYAIFEPRKKYLEISIKNPLNDSLLARLKFNYQNPYLNTRDQTSIQKFISDRVKIFVNVPRIIVFDDKTRNQFILDYNFKIAFPSAVSNVELLKPISGDKSYFWICQEKCGLYDVNGKKIIPQTHDVVYANGDFLKIGTGKRYAGFDYRGNVVIPYNVYDAFEISNNNIARIFHKEYFPRLSGVLYVDLVTKDTIKVESGYPFNDKDFAVAEKEEKLGVINKKGEWVIKPHALTNDVRITSDSLVFIELKNPKFYNIYGKDRQYWYHKFVLKLPDSLQGRTNLLTIHPDFEPREYVYVLFNLKTNEADTITVDVKALDGNPSYQLSLESNTFVNGYAKLRISFLDGTTSKWFYSFLSRTGKIVNVLKKYHRVKDMSKRGMAIVKLKTERSSRTKEFEGVITASGEEVVPCEFSSVSENRYGFIVFSDDGKWGLIDFDGDTLIEPVLDYHEVENLIMDFDNPFIESSTINFK